MTPIDNFKQRVRNPRLALKKQDADASRKSFIWDLLKNVGLAIAALSAAGALFGYGVSLALTANFGYSSGIWYTSTLELISLCGEGFIGAVSAVTSRFEPMTLLLVMTAYGAAFALIVLLTLVGGLAYLSHDDRIRRWRQGLIESFSPPKQKGRIRVSRTLVQRGAALVVTAGVGGFLLVPAVGLALAVLLSAFSVIPLLGYSAGTAYAKDLIVGPRHCVSPLKKRIQAEKTHKTGKQEVGADCIEVSNADTGETFSGRLIVGRPSYAVLYRPDQDDVVVVILKTGSMRSIHSLDGSP